MPLLAALTSGELGVRCTPPAGWTLSEESDTHAAFVDPQTGLRIWLLQAADVPLDLRPESREHLLQHMRWHTRTMLTHTTRTNFPSQEQVRTEDPAWQALVEAEDTVVDGSPALWMVHRMLYHPGHELLMAHLMVPVGKGLFEVRLAASEEGATGQRESALLLVRQLTGDPSTFPADDPFLGMTQADYDAPEHDDAYPAHPLSRVRAARTGLVEALSLEVSGTAEAPPAQVALEAQGGRLTLPPRFVRIDDLPDGTAAFRRTSVCASDGVETLYVRRGTVSRGPSEQLAELMFEQLQEDHLNQGVKEVDARTEALTELDGWPWAFGTVDGVAGMGPLRTGALWFGAAGGDLVQLDLIGGVPERPRDDLLAELRAAAESWEPLRKKRWWWPFG